MLVSDCSISPIVCLKLGVGSGEGIGEGIGYGIGEGIGSGIGEGIGESIGECIGECIWEGIGEGIAVLHLNIPPPIATTVLSGCLALCCCSRGMYQERDR